MTASHATPWRFASLVMPQMTIELSTSPRGGVSLSTVTSLLERLSVLIALWVVRYAPVWQFARPANKTSSFEPTNSAMETALFGTTPTSAVEPALLAPTIALPALLLVVAPPATTQLTIALSTTPLPDASPYLVISTPTLRCVQFALYTVPPALRC